MSSCFLSVISIDGWLNSCHLPPHINIPMHTVYTSYTWAYFRKSYIHMIKKCFLFFVSAAFLFNFSLVFLFNALSYWTWSIHARFSEVNSTFLTSLSLSFLICIATAWTWSIHAVFSVVINQVHRPANLSGILQSKSFSTNFTTLTCVHTYLHLHRHHTYIDT